MLRIKKNKLSMRTKPKNNRLSKIGVIIAYIYIYNKNEGFLLLWNANMFKHILIF